MLLENSCQFNGKHYVQTHGTAMGTKTAVSFANIFMAHIGKTILSRTVFKPTVWKRYIDDIFFLWDISKPDIEAFIEQANLFWTWLYNLVSRIWKRGSRLYTKAHE